MFTRVTLLLEQFKVSDLARYVYAYNTRAMHTHFRSLKKNNVFEKKKNRRFAISIDNNITHAHTPVDRV